MFLEFLEIRITLQFYVAVIYFLQVSSVLYRKMENGDVQWFSLTLYFLITLPNMRRISLFFCVVT